MRLSEWLILRWCSCNVCMCSLSCSQHHHHFFIFLIPNDFAAGSLGLLRKYEFVKWSSRLNKRCLCSTTTTRPMVWMVILTYNYRRKACLSIVVIWVLFFSNFVIYHPHWQSYTRGISQIRKLKKLGPNITSYTSCNYYYYYGGT